MHTVTRNDAGKTRFRTGKEKSRQRGGLSSEFPATTSTQFDFTVPAHAANGSPIGTAIGGSWVPDLVRGLELELEPAQPATTAVPDLALVLSEVALVPELYSRKPVIGSS